MSPHDAMEFLNECQLDDDLADEQHPAGECNEGCARCAPEDEDGCEHCGAPPSKQVPTWPVTPRDTNTWVYVPGQCPACGAEVSDR